MIVHLNLAFLCVDHYLTVNYAFTAEVIPYREQWNRVTILKQKAHCYSLIHRSRPYIVSIIIDTLINIIIRHCLHYCLRIIVSSMHPQDIINCFFITDPCVHDTVQYRLIAEGSALQCSSSLSTGPTMSWLRSRLSFSLLSCCHVAKVIYLGFMWYSQFFLWASHPLSTSNRQCHLRITANRPFEHLNTAYISLYTHFSFTLHIFSFLHHCIFTFLEKKEGVCQVRSPNGGVRVIKLQQLVKEASEKKTDS